MRAPTRNLILQPYEIPCQARDDVGKVMRSRIKRGMTTARKTKSLRAPTRNLVQQHFEILCQAQNDRGYVDNTPLQTYSNRTCANAISSINVSPLSSIQIFSRSFLLNCALSCSPRLVIFTIALLPKTSTTVPS